MPATVFHNLTATTPEDPAYEIRSQHWNSQHGVSISAVGSEIIGAFSNAVGGVSFAQETNGFITASAPGGGGMSTHSANYHSGNIIPNAVQDFGNNALSIGTAGVPAASADRLVFYGFDEHGKTRLGMITPDGSQITHAQDAFIIARNTSGAPIAAGKAVYVTGSTGQTPNISPARANAGSTMPSIGITTDNIADNAFGRVQVMGTADKLDTSAFMEGDRLWVSDAVAGDLTATEPSYPSIRQRVAVVINSHATQGKLLVLNTSARGEFGIQAVSAGTTQFTSGGAVFSNSNGISFGANGNTVTASHNGLTTAALSNHSHAFSASGGSSNFQTLNFANSNGVTFSNSNGSVIASHNGLTTAAQSNHSHGNPQLNLTNLSGTTASASNGLTLSLSAAAQSVQTQNSVSVQGSTGAIQFSNSNGITFGGNASTITASHNGLTTAAQSNHSHGNPTLNLTNLSGTTASNSAGFTLSLSVAAPGGGGAINVSAGTTSGNLQTIQFDNANGVSFGLNGSTVTASVNAGGGAFAAGMSNLGNTIGTSGTVADRFVLAGGNGITLSQSIDGGSATITFNSPDPESRWINEPSITQVGTVMNNSLVSIVPLQIPYLLNATNLRFGVSCNMATAANNSIAFQDISASIVIYTRNSDTLNSIASGSNTFTGTWSSNATGSFVGPRGLTIAIDGSTQFPRGEYWMAVHMRTTNTGTGANSTALANSISMLVGATAGTAAMGLDPYATPTASSRGASIGLGVISTGATRDSIDFSQITQTGTRAMVAKLWCDFRNYSLW